MSESMIIQKEIELTASKQKVWQILTSPEMTKQYMYGCEIVSDWKVGSAVIWNGRTESSEEVTYVKGHVVEIDEGERVKFTVFDPNMGIKDVPKNYINQTYELIEAEGSTLLRLTQDGFSTAAQGQKRYEDAIKGWDMVLPLIKELAEK